jgi:hypothetical protein
MILALGSWRDMRLPVLVERPFSPPKHEQLVGRPGEDSQRIFDGGGRMTALALEWQEEFERKTAEKGVQVDILLRSGKTLRAVYQGEDTGLARLSLGNLEQPVISREISANFDRISFSVVMQQNQLEFAAQSAVGAAPFFREKVMLPGIAPKDVARISCRGMAAVELTMEE